MFAKLNRGAPAPLPALAVVLAGQSGAAKPRAEGTTAAPPAGGSARPLASGQPSARHLAQMRLAADKAGIPADFAELMAEAGVTAAGADAMAAGLAQVNQIAAPYL